MKSRRWALLVGGVLLAGACSSAHPSTPTLVTGTSPTGAECKWAMPGQWASMKTHPTEFGIDYIGVVGHDPVKIDFAELQNAENLKLSDLAFVKGGGIGNGAAFGDLAVVPDKEAWAQRQKMPGAQLTPLPNDAYGDSGQWQAVIGLVPLGPVGGTASALVLTYHVGGQVFHLQGTIGMAVVRDESGCPTD
jgi:hypothetical protein